MADIPIVDFGKFLNGEKGEKERVSQEIDNAFRKVGFVYLQNHGVDTELVEACFEWVRHSCYFHEHQGAIK
jgi:isopenicillin N synthase-like dioxygenase